MQASDVIPAPRRAARVLGVLLVLHGLAHTLPGMRITDATRWGGAGSGILLWVATVLWAVTVVGLVGGGMGLLGAAAFRAHWRKLVLLGVGASLALLASFWRSPWALAGVLLDASVLVVLLRTPAAEPSASGTESRSMPVHARSAGRRRRVLRGLGNGAAVGFVLYLGLLVLSRPWHMRWGSTEAELHASLPGDEVGVVPTYQIQHAVLIHAPAEEIWPWLVQIGHDRGGFYSYAWLENLFGLSVKNADRIHPEWQSLVEGDSVLATPDNYLGTGRRFGWRVGRVEPNRVLVLESWGAFVLEPVDSATTRLIVRTLGAGGESLSGIVLAPVGLLLFEPAHFIMERKMLLEIRERAERLPPARQRLRYSAGHLQRLPDHRGARP
jgi:hypothetical protein